MYVYWLKIIKYCCIYIDIDKELYVLKLARCLDYWFFDLVVTKTRAFLFFSCFLFFSFLFFPFFYFCLCCCCCCCCCSFFSFFNWKEKLSFRAWKGSEIYRSNSRCSTISPLDGHALNRPFHVFLLLLLFFFFFSSFSTFDINESEKIRQLRSKESV